jgi:ubiquitin thioesterase protein OTUB1
MSSGGVTQFQNEIDSAAAQDELTLKQQEAIDKEISSRIALVGDRESVLTLLPEYASDLVYKDKIMEISKTYEFFRRTRPDGNCFFRAFCYGSIERILGNPTAIQEYRDKLVASKETLKATGFTQFTVDDFYDTFLDVVDKVADGLAASELLKLFQEPSLADYLVVYLRILTSAELRKSAEFYSNFIEGERTLEEFCQFEVEPMYKESDHIHITALTTALGIGVRVIYMDRGLGGQHDFPDPENIAPSIYLLYRPGHYDILYPKGT